MRQKTKKLNFLWIFTASLIVVFSLTSCGFFNKKTAKKFTETAFFLDTIVSITVYSEADSAMLPKCLQLCAEYEKIFSRTDSESELFALNECGSMAVSEHLLNVISTAKMYSEISEGRFDFTMGGVSSLYNFSSESPALPSDSELKEAMSHVGWENIIIDGDTVTLVDGEAIIDLGAIAKGYIADRLCDLLRENGVESAIIDLGGNILCLGSKPDGSQFKVGIQYPYKDSSQYITAVSITDMSVVTSGVYQRYFEQSGVRYHHILDPDTGVSIDNGLISVSIIGEKSVDCDALSTTVFALGLEKGMELINSLENTYAVFITEDMEVHYSEGFDVLER
ncbi:MAG: FAD:protein FMN transferase [Oscillospiraceae bacterium]|nr:FAD:protein FMN transferase [Oscillospiraceae bacterium]